MTDKDIKDFSLVKSECLPCPICGTEKIYLTKMDDPVKIDDFLSGRKRDTYKDKYQIFCKCGVMGAIGYTMEEAKECWNGFKR